MLRKDINIAQDLRFLPYLFKSREYSGGFLGELLQSTTIGKEREIKMAERSQEEMRTYQGNHAKSLSFLEKRKQEREEWEIKRKLRERYPYSDKDNEFLTWNEYCYFHS